MNILHEGQRFQKCNTCEKSLFDVSNLKRHIYLYFILLMKAKKITDVIFVVNRFFLHKILRNIYTQQRLQM